MALFDIFKKKKKVEEKKKEIKKKEIKKKVKKPAVPVKEIKKPAVRPQPQKTSAIAYRVLKMPQVTEKATDLTKKNQYVFRVFRETNKKEIKKTIEDLYGVDVLNVKIINIPAKQRRLGRSKGWRQAYKKAIVRVKEGQKIEVLPR